MGLFGLLGSGNLGNDGSLQAVLDWLRGAHPDAEIGCLCAGPDEVAARYGIPATALHRFGTRRATAAGPARAMQKVTDRVADTVRILRWVRRFDVVIVPGMGVLEATLPLRPWQFPYSLLTLCVSARLTGTTVALMGVGADDITGPVTRWMIRTAARLARHRSFRDTLSRDAVRRMGVDTSRDPVHPDLAFALPEPPPAPVEPGTVGVGVMAYHGGNGDRARAGEIHAAYVEGITGFVRWLVDRDRRVLLFTGDAADAAVVDAILADLRLRRPDLDPERVVAPPVSTLADLMARMRTVETVVATRYHNVLCAVKLGKPTLSVGYAAKNDVLMAEVGLAEFCHPARVFDLTRLVEQFSALEERREHLARITAERSHALRRWLDTRLDNLSAELFPGSRVVDRRSVR